MSYDFDTTLSRCDHFQIRERMIVDPSDWRTLLYASDKAVRTRGPIVNEQLVSLYIRGIKIPKNHPVYGWDIREDERTTLDPNLRLRKIMFRLPVRSTGLLMELDYNTTPGYCLKCMGSGRKNDFVQSQTRSFVHITETPKLLQRILKHILTSVCAFYPTYTSPLREFIGRKFGVSLAEDDVSYEVSSALGNMRKIQTAQKRVQTLSPQEVLKAIDGVSVVRSVEDPSRVKVSVQVSSYGKERPNPLSFTLKSNR